MTHSVYFDSKVSDEQRRAAVYDGQLFVYSSLPSVRRFADFTRGMIEEAFAPLDPQTAQHELSVERFAEILGELKPRFIHHPESKQHVIKILEELGCDLEETYFDVPRLRSLTSDAYLNTGIAYAYHPHRDTWCSAPSCQVNFWLPVYEVQSNNAMAFHSAYWNRRVPNNSHLFNYYMWNKHHRGPEVAKLVTEDSRPLPRPSERIDIDPQLRLLPPVGGILAFSGAHMHSSVPNTSGRTRFSIDFRTVHRLDALHRRGAPRCDEECTGTTIRDYLRGADLVRLPEEVVALHDDDTAASGEAIYRPHGG